jgi:uncharacterized protein
VTTPRPPRPTWRGRKPPRHEDSETTFAELRARIARCLAYLDTFTEADFEKTTGQTVITHRTKKLLADEYLFARQIPNFYFHVTTAYDLLRHGGVELGKGDYLGPLTYVEG